MRVLVEIGHPAHVHFFRATIARLKELGHSVIVTTRNKDITNQLCEDLKIPYICLSRPFSRRWLLLELAWRWASTFFLILRHRIDTTVSISGITTSFPSKITGAQAIVFTDTEDAKISNWIAFPFSDAIYTPDFYLGDLGARHLKYPGLHELAYLQDFDFVAAAQRRKELGLPEKYFILRTIANDALHDWDIKGVSARQMRDIIETLSPHGKVFITAEGNIHPDFKEYQLKTPLADIHAILSGATAFIGESPTMAVESSLLGTPAYLLSQRVGRLGNMQGLEKKFALLNNFERAEHLLTHLKKVSDFNDYKRRWGIRARFFRTSSERMDDLILGAILGKNNKAELCAA